MSEETVGSDIQVSKERAKEALQTAINWYHNQIDKDISDSIPENKKYNTAREYFKQRG